VKSVRLLFMGASRLVGLAERFNDASQRLGIRLEMFSLEDSKPWHAIGVAGLARVLSAPPFSDSGFSDYLTEVCQQHQVDIVVPCIDRATIALADSTARLREAGVLPLVASLEVCEAMADKLKSDEIFRLLGLRVPTGQSFPLLAKPRFGASSRDITVFHEQEEYDFWRKRHAVDDYLVQPFIRGTEYSLDAYVGESGKLIGVVSRIRHVVTGGEAMVTETRHYPEAEAMVERLTSWSRWHGPLTVQVIDDGQVPWLLECNPRFGSGVTCSIEAGLEAPEWILRERLGLPLPTDPLQWRNGLMMTRSRKDHFVWLS
jgi:carbamoyl-phosphate synthase large subunit